MLILARPRLQDCNWTCRVSSHRNLATSPSSSRRHFTLMTRPDKKHFVLPIFAFNKTLLIFKNKDVHSVLNKHLTMPTPLADGTHGIQAKIDMTWWNRIVTKVPKLCAAIKSVHQTSMMSKSNAKNPAGKPSASCKCGEAGVCTTKSGSQNSTFAGNGK